MSENQVQICRTCGFSSNVPVVFYEHSCRDKVSILRNQVDELLAHRDTLLIQNAKLKIEASTKRCDKHKTTESFLPCVPCLETALVKANAKVDELIQKVEALMRGSHERESQK